MKQTFPFRESPIPFTSEGYQKVVDEKNKLTDERPDAVDNLRKAREMGDLSENGYYKAARARLSTLDARLRSLTRLIRLAEIAPLELKKRATTALKTTATERLTAPIHNA